MAPVAITLTAQDDSTNHLSSHMAYAHIRTISTPADPIINITTVCILGAGYVGGPTGAVIALKCPHVKVVVADLSPDRIDAWNSETLPIFEPELDTVVMACRGNNLFFTTDVAAAIAEAQLIFIAVNTPTKMTGIGGGLAADISYIESATRHIAFHATSDKIIVEKSTVPVRTASSIAKILKANQRHDVNFEILSNPEFLSEGSAIRNLLEPDRVLIGSMRTASGLAAEQSLFNLYASWVDRDRIITTGLWSSELAKLASNALLAQRISSINSLAAVCEATGANVTEVAFAAGLDSRIGTQFLKTSIGFGGSCFRKDSYLCESLNLPEVAEYWRQVVRINEYTKSRFSRQVVRTLFDTITNKRIALLGFAYKKNTGDTRESPSISLAQSFREELAHVVIYDPCVRHSQIWTDLHAAAGRHTSLDELKEHYSIARSAEEACVGADAVIIATEWVEFVSLDWKRIYDSMNKPAFLFDGRVILQGSALRKLGFIVKTIGIGDE